MDEISGIAERVRRSTSVPGLLDAVFDAFETIRSVARTCEGQTSQLFPAFMMAAGAAVEGRNAINDAPSLLPPHGQRPPPAMGPSADAARVADELASLAALLAKCLPDAATKASMPGDRTACQQAAQAAGEIHRLLARNGDETVTR